MKRVWLLVIGYGLLVNSFNSAYAKEITILYTGETHAMIYHCNCLKEPDGGVSRRATLLKELRRENPNSLVLDSGAFFAGGLQDEYTQNTELDKERSLVQLKAMEIMQYDALALGDDEFNFGEEFLKERVVQTNLTFLSSNLKFEKVFPYLIKEVAGIKVGIVGVTALSVMDKATGIKLIDPKMALTSAIAELRKNGVKLTVVLSHLGESEDLRLINEVAGIDILISGHLLDKKEPSTKIGSTLLLRPVWQGRSLGKLTFTFENNKIEHYTVEQLRLSDKIKDDPQIISILPRCFSDANCKRQGAIGTCLDPGSSNSRCEFTQATPLNLFIITPKACRVCDSERLVKYFQRVFAGLTSTYIYYPAAKANKFIKDFNLKTLPAYFFDKKIEKEKEFVKLKENLEGKGDFYLLNTRIGGVSYFIERKMRENNLDLFISLYDKNTPALLEMIREFNPVVHFLALEQDGKFDAAKGKFEVEEYLRGVCVKKYYPGKFWDYLSCRTKNNQSAWWEDCLPNLERDKIKTCAQGEEGKALLREDTSLNKELGIMFGPAFLLDNQEIFAVQTPPTKEEFKKIIKR